MSKVEFTGSPELGTPDPCVLDLEDRLKRLCAAAFHDGPITDIETTAAARFQFTKLLVNAFRTGQLVIADQAERAAEARGFERGIREAAEAMEAEIDTWLMVETRGAMKRCLNRALTKLSGEHLAKPGKEPTDG